MDRFFHMNNRTRLYENMEKGTVLVLFAGEEIRKTQDTYYPFFANRNFLYLTGISQKCSVLQAVKGTDGAVTETLYILPKDPMAERWTGRWLCADEAIELSGVCNIMTVDEFEMNLHNLLLTGECTRLYLDLYRQASEDMDTQAHRLADWAGKCVPHIGVLDINPAVRRLRTVKQPCEIDALRKAEQITREGILAMMKASRPGMYEYQYKAEFDRAIGQYGPQGPGFYSIISAGNNNFCIHYDSYTGRAEDGDMILNDVGAQYGNLIVDVSRGWPCNGKFSRRQRLLYECALKTSDYMFSIIRPGMKMKEVDATIRRCNARLLVEAGVMDSVEDVATYMWHGGAHHIGYDVHDAIEMPEELAPGMVFCVDVGIYHEAWGIGFRLEDNCLVTDNGCENLSAEIPRTIEEIEAVMAR